MLSWNRLKKFKKLFLLLLIHILTIFMVTLIFKGVPDRKVAAMMASTLFLSFPLWVFISNLRFLRYIYWGHFQFFYFFALPIFLARIMYWEKDFQNIYAFGVISAQQIHKYSNYSYLIMITLTVFQLLVELYLDKKAEGPSIDNELKGTQN